MWLAEVDARPIASEGRERRNLAVGDEVPVAGCRPADPGWPPPVDEGRLVAVMIQASLDGQVRLIAA